MDDVDSRGISLLLLERDPMPACSLSGFVRGHPLLKAGEHASRPSGARLVIAGRSVVMLEVALEEQAARLCRELRSRRPSIACLIIDSADLDEALFTALTTRGEPVPSASDPLEGLGDQQRRIAKAVARGLSNAQIGAELHLSPHTVRNHLSRIMRHLGVRNRTELAVALVHLRLGAHRERGL